MPEMDEAPENPFASPQTYRQPDEGPPWGTILRVARYQRWVTWALLGSVPLTILFAAVVFQPISIANLMIARLFLSAILLSVVAAYHVGSELYSRWMGGLLILPAFVPGLSILVLALLNHQAIRFLRGHKVRLGLFGANLSQLRERAKADIQARRLRERSHK